MADYRRLISYIYEYEGKEKGKNVGFAKLETRNGQCRLNVSVKKIYVGGNAIGVYLLGKGRKETFLGNLFARGGSGEFRALVDAGNVEGSGNAIHTYYGLTVHDVKNGWRAYTTIWDDEMRMEDEREERPADGEPETDGGEAGTSEMLDAAELFGESMDMSQEEMEPVSGGDTELIQAGEEETPDPAHISESAGDMAGTGEVGERPDYDGGMSRPLSQEISGASEEEKERGTENGGGQSGSSLGNDRTELMAEDILPGAEKAMPVVSRVVKEIEEEIAKEEARRESESAETPVPAVSAPGVQSEKEAPAAEKEALKPAPPASSPELENPEVLKYLQETEARSLDSEQLWTELRKSYPKIQPFEYEYGCEILTIRPQDIGRLSRESWVYGNNSFLLHGYYSYRYLILVRLNSQNGRPRYLIGVPGHYYSSEKYMASMFGFPNFVLSKKQPVGDGRFGYWYTDVRLH